MRVVLDTNILISGLFWGGIPHVIYRAAMQRQFTLITSTLLFAELSSVVQREKFTQQLERKHITASAFLQNYQQLAQFVESQFLPESAIRDPKDREVLGCALGGQVDYIVSGDQDLLVLETYHAIPIITATEFARLLERE